MIPKMYPRAGNLGWKIIGLPLMWILLALPAAVPRTGLARDRDGFLGDVPPPPPEPNPLDIEVPRGGPVWITLSAYSLTSTITGYRIKRPAKAGKLGVIQMMTADTGRVWYKPPAGAGPGRDSFSYEVQSRAGVSAPADVNITITDTDPVLIAPNDIEFGELLRGETARRSLVLQNIGGGLAEGTVRVPEGWTVEGDAAYSLGAGEKQTFTLIFKPTAERLYTGDIEYTGNPERATDLNGEEVAPIAVSSGTVELREAGEMRIGTVHVVNRTGDVRTLKVTAGPGLDADDTVKVPGKGAADILVRVKKGDGEIRDEVTVEGDGFKAVVPVHALSVEAMERMELRPTTIGQETSRAPVAQIQGGPAAAARMAGPVTPVAPVEGADPGLPEMDLLPAAPDESSEPAAGMPVWPLARGTVTERDALVGCNFKGNQPAHTYRLDVQSVGIDASGRPVAQWAPFTHAMLQEKGSIVIAQMMNLEPGTLYVVRLVGLDALGNIVQSSSAGQVWTPVAKRPWGWWGAGVAAVALAAGGAWFWRRRREDT
jgi:hypothetical protein